MKKLLLLLVLAALLSGCIYYNTFYNAKQYFKTAYEEPLRDNGKPSHIAIQNYTKAMKKCGIILTDYKESKWADDALFMLAQCLYYRQTKLTEAKNKFEEVIQFYPDSDFALQSPIYIARCLHDMNQEEKAYQKLREYIVSAQSRKYLPEALMLIAEYFLQDENYSQAEYNYQKLIDEYPKSEYHKQAFFALGTLYHENKEYYKAIETFEAFLKIRAEKKDKLEAKYYIASSYLLAGEYETAENKIEKLLEEEYRDDELNSILLLKARVLANSFRTDEADIIFDQLIQENPKTKLSAECNFWRAEMHFRLLNNYERAIEYYNNVRTEYAQSEYVENAVTHSAVASQILQYNTGSKDIELTQLISQQMKLAEYYIEVLELPDSAMVVYDGIISYKDEIELRRDSLQFQFDNLDLEALRDSALAEEAQLDSLTSPEPMTIVLEDTTNVEEVKLPAKADSLQNKILALSADIKEYENNFIPYVQFVKLWMYQTVYKDSSSVIQTLTYLQENHPHNRYTYAAEKFLSGEPVEFITEKDKAQRSIMNTALDILTEQPDSSLVLLKELCSDSTSTYYNQALFTRSYIQYHVFDDTLKAKPLIDSLIARAPASQWAEHISLFYDGQRFKALDRLPALVELEEREKHEKEAKEAAENEEEELIMELEDIEKPESSPGSAGNPNRSARPRPNK